MRFRNLIFLAAASGLASRLASQLKARSIVSQAKSNTASGPLSDATNPAEQLSDSGLIGAEGFHRVGAEAERGSIPGVADFTRGA